MMDDYYTHQRQGGNYMYLNDKEITPKGHATELFTSWSVDYIKKEAKEKNPFFFILPTMPPFSFTTTGRVGEQGTGKRQVVTGQACTADSPD